MDIVDIDSEEKVKDKKYFMIHMRNKFIKEEKTPQVKRNKKTPLVRK